MTLCSDKKHKDTGYAKKLGEDDAHLKLFVKQTNSEGIPAIGFDWEKNGINYKSKAFEAVYCIDENEWNGKVSIQLRLKNIK
jgi:single-stranded-DNA-specific exonuclease